MTSTLSGAGISYQLQNNGTAIAVQANQAAKARVALAGADLLGNTQPGFSLFEKQNLGESNFQQQVTYQRALQGQLEETIDSVQGVSGAQVELVLPSSQNQIFGENQSASSAAVLLSGTTSLDSELGTGDRAAGHLERPRPAAEQGHDHRRLRASCCGRRPAAAPAAGRARTCRKPSSATTRAWRRASTRCSPRRSAPARRRCSCTPT